MMIITASMMVFLNTISIIVCDLKEDFKDLKEDFHEFEDNLLSEIAKHVKMSGASDIIVVKNAKDGTLTSSPILVHFGHKIVASNGTSAKEGDGFSVQIAINDKTIDGMALKADENGNVAEPNANLAPLNAILKTHGRYNVQFTAKDSNGQTVSVDCFLHYLDSNAKLVISDIDGTVTKSDVRGMLLGNVWMQDNVRTLYEQIIQRSYQLVYLSARPVPLGTYTRDFLKKMEMPAGILLLSHEPLEKAMKTMLVDPQRVKIICLSQLKELFNNRSPFFAAFGNQESDKITYDTMPVPTVFMVNPKGEVTIYRNGAEQSTEEETDYRHVIDQMMDKFFPPVN